MVQDVFVYLTRFGYGGIFLISLLGSATIIFPFPAAAFVIGAASFLNPLILGIIAGIGSTFGEVVGYAFGRGGRAIGEKRYEEELKKAEKKLFNYKILNRPIWERSSFMALVLFAATPLPDDVIGIVSGAVKYDVRRFLVAVLIGKVILHLGLAFGGYYGIKEISNFFL